jgi:hypothetical protein
MLRSKMPNIGISAGKRDGDPESRLSRRAMLVGGAGVAALVAMPDLAPGAAQAAVRQADAAGPSGAASGHFFLYGVTDDPGHAARVQAVQPPGALPATAPGAVSVTTDFAATPVASPGQSLLGLTMVTMAASGAAVTFSVVSKATSAVTRTASFTIPGVPADTGILVTPAFSPDLSVVTLVVAITVRTAVGMAPKLDPRTGGTQLVEAATLRSRHALAYLDMRTGSLAGPFYLGDEGTLALSTAVATDSELFLWTTMDPQALHMTKGYRRAAPLPRISVFPFGTENARFTVPSPAPWPGGEPAVALATGDVARLVNARTLQVVSARNGDLSEVSLAPLSASRAKPTPATMTARADGSLFVTKVGVGRAALVDPARGFKVTSDVRFPEPDKPSGGPVSKAVLSPTGDRLYVLGGAGTGGLSSYDMATGAMIASYAHGVHYTGVYQLASGTLLATGARSPRLSFFSPDLNLLGTADAGISIAEVY